MNSKIQDEALQALEEFLADPVDLDRFEKRVAGLWVANNRNLDGVLGEVYDIMADWDHKFPPEVAVQRLREIASVTRGPEENVHQYLASSDTEKLEIHERTIVFEGPATPGWIPAGAAEPLPYRKSVVLNFTIEAEAGLGKGYFLLGRTSSGELLVDSWFASKDEAIEQATLCFGITASEWKRAPAGA